MTALEGTKEVGALEVAEVTKDISIRNNKCSVFLPAAQKGEDVDKLFPFTQRSHVSYVHRSQRRVLISSRGVEANGKKQNS